MKIKCLVSGENQYPLDAELDLQNRSLKLLPSEVNGSSIFEALFSSDFEKVKNCKHNGVSFSVLTEENTVYFLGEAFYSFSMTYHPKFEFTKFQYIIENHEIDLSKTNLEGFKAIHYEDHSLGAAMSPRKININYNGFIIEIYRESINDEFIKPEKYDLVIIINSKNKKYDEYLIIYQLILDLISIILGKTPPLKSTFIKYLENESSYFYSPIQKYNCISFGNIHLADYVSKDTINEENLAKLNEIKNKYLIILNVIITQFNIDSYIELRLSSLLQCFEGYYKNTINLKSNAKDAFNYMFSLKETQTILNKCDSKCILLKNGKKERTFIQFLYIHRNYFSHYNSRTKNKLEDVENYYVLQKVSLALRIILLNDITGNLNIKFITSSIEKIEKLAQLHNVRLKYIEGI